MKKGNLLKKCGWCGEEFFSWKHQKREFCSNKCSGFWQTRNKRNEKMCQFCGKIFIHIKSRERKYCSYKCYLLYRSKFSSILNCKICNKPFKVKNSDIKRGRKFCSQGCMGIYYSKIKQGKNNHSYVDGKSKERKLERDAYRDTIEYKNWRRAIYIRDNYTCQKCGRRRKVGDRVNIQAHHIKSWKDYPKLRFKITNGKTLCKECHQKR